MKRILLLYGFLLTGAVSCQKESQREEEIPFGKWVSIAFDNIDGNWVNDPSPHYWTFTKDANTKYFIFRDHNGAECQGEFNLVTPINSYAQLNFLNPNCGLISREIESYKPDTMVLRALEPVSKPGDRVMYQRIE